MQRRLVPPSAFISNGKHFMASAMYMQTTPVGPLQVGAFYTALENKSWDSPCNVHLDCTGGSLYRWEAIYIAVGNKSWGFLTMYMEARPVGAFTGGSLLYVSWLQYSD